MARIVITGCSRGIGLELARQAVGREHQVLALTRNTGPLEGLHPNLRVFSLDLAAFYTSEELDGLLEGWGPIDGLIHNAGKLIHKPFLELSAAELDEVYQVNVLGVARLTQRILPYMNKEGHVVGVSSMGGVQGSSKFPGLSAYSSSKAALIGFIELWAEEFKETGPSFNALALGAVQTEMLAEAFPGYQVPMTPERMAGYILDFTLTGHHFYNGKLLQVSNSVP